MNNYDRQRKDKLIATLLKAREAVDRVLLYVVPDDENRMEVMDIEDAAEHINIALERLTEVKTDAR